MIPECHAAAYLAALLERCSLEVSARDATVAGRLRGRLDPGSRVFISFPPGETHHRIVATAAALKRCGFDPVPHVAARNLASYTQLDDYLRRAAGDAGVKSALVIAGDAAQPIGPFASSIDAIETGLFERHGIRSLGIAGHPEGAPRVTPQTLEAALAAKLELARRHGLDLWIATQFCFEAAPIVAWIAAVRAHGIALPVRIGLAGPAGVATLLKFALRCGIGNSLRALHAHADSLTRLLGEGAPDELVRALADAFHNDPGRGLLGLHFFTFGGVMRTLDWLAGLRAAEGARPPP